MKFAKRLRTLTILVAALTAAGCISAWIDMGTGKYRALRFEPQTRDTIREEMGPPFESYPSDRPMQFVLELPQRAVAYDVFKVTGKIANAHDGSSEATLNAITLGAGEAIAIPLTLINVAVESASGTRFLVFYYDLDGKKVEDDLLLPDGQRDVTF